MLNESKYKEALKYRPENIQSLFPDSNALIVSGKVIHQAMVQKREKGQRALSIAANGRNEWVIEGALRAAHKTKSALLVEIAKSESTYCAVTLENISTQVNEIINKNNLKVVVGIHADHYAIKNQDDVEKAKKQIPNLIRSGITSFALDASHLPPDQNVLINLELTRLLPPWISLETEVGEIKGDAGLSTPEEALFHIQALNAYGIFPTWIALNNGSTHGLEATGGNIQVDLTAKVHQTIRPYGVFGAQHGTSGNNYKMLRAIVNQTETTKANVATALQMISWGLKVNEFGNAERDADKNFIKLPNRGVTDEIWKEMDAIAQKNNWKSGDYKKLNLVADPLLKDQPKEIQERMIKDVEDFVVNLFQNVFYCTNTAELALDLILEAKSPNIVHFNRIIESKSKWTSEYIRTEGKKLLEQQEKIKGHFDD